MVPKISIIVPVYNVEHYLHRCINSILNQTFKDYELILVNDGSTDLSSKICNDYAQNNKKIKVIHQDNGGAASARNSGMEIALGDYIAFVDGDDFIHTKMYEDLYNVAKENDSDIVVCDFIKIKEDMDYKTEGKLLNNNIFNYSNLEALEKLYSSTDQVGNNLTMVLPVNKIYKKNLFNTIKFVEGKICEDEFMAHRILYESKKISYIPKILYFYVQRSNSVMNSPYSIKRLDKVYALKDRVEFFKEINQRKLLNLAIRSFIDSYFWNYYKVKIEIPYAIQTIRKLSLKGNNLIFTLVNPMISWKQKIFISLFALNPYFYDIYIEKKIVKPIHK